MSLFNEGKSIESATKSRSVEENSYFRLVCHCQSLTLQISPKMESAMTLIVERAKCNSNFDRPLAQEDMQASFMLFLHYSLYKVRLLR